MSPEGTRDSLQQLRQAASAAPMLDLDTERELLRRIQENGDPRALDALLVSHVRLVLSIAQKYRRHGLPVDDLVAEGNLGLVEAARRFDRARGTRFSTYAAWWVRALIRRYTIANRRIVGAPSTRAARRLLSNLRETQRRLAAELGRAATREEIARALDVSVEDVATVDAALSGRDVSLAPTPEGLVIELACDRASPEETAAAAELRAHNERSVHDALERLERRERLIIERRLLDDDRETLADIGAELGLSRERVRQLELRARQKLRAALLDRVA
ncbi:MAG: sigma-70 family RNA polymerase sigma factor [Sandaracinaceae bacterium]|nr:sigma-70 family RNA polymerase sigma factor [Sandaracinaceae bacterium]